MQNKNIAVVCATDLVGEAFLTLLKERKYPIGKLYVLDDSSEAIGDTVMFGNQAVLIESIDGFDFSLVDYVLFLGRAETAKKYAPKAALENIMVIDASGAFAQNSSVPLVIAGVNDDDIPRTGLLALPNSAMIQLCQVLKPIDEAVGLSRVDFSIFQGVSAKGKTAVEELAKQTANILNARPVTSTVLPKQIAFNLIPSIGELQENGSTQLEETMVNGVRTVLDNQDLSVYPSLVQVPIFYGEGITLTIQMQQPLTVTQFTDLVKGKVTISEDMMPTPVSEASGENEVFVGRIRQQDGDVYTISLWLVADNIKQGIATNCMQLIEKLD